MRQGATASSQSKKRIWQIIMGNLKIHNWEKWQSYRADRGQPPWIKIHRECMRNVEWVSLTDAQRGQLVAIWLLAADHNGVIPASPLILKKLCHLDTEPNLKLFIEQGFIDGDASLTPERRQHDQPETETETETETENTTHKNFIPPVDNSVLQDWLAVRKAKRAGKLTLTAWNGLEREAKKAGILPEDAVKICCERSWISFRADWMVKDSIPAKRSDNWWISDKAIEAKGAELGLYARPGESWNDLKGRINSILEV